MISWKDLYSVLTTVVSLYVAMILANGSVRWWKIFSPEQCDGINRFVAIFAVPLLSFHFISNNDTYSMNFRFLSANTLQETNASGKCNDTFDINHGVEEAYPKPKYILQSDGLVWSPIAFRWHLGMPRILEKSISILPDAGLGMAMFSLGLFMSLQPKIIACGNSVAAFAMAVRFLTGSAVMAATFVAVGLRGILLHIAIVQAALPQGIVPFVFAKEYNVHPTILSTAVIFGMLIALPITLIYYVHSSWIVNL